MGLSDISMASFIQVLVSMEGFLTVLLHSIGLNDHDLAKSVN